MNGLLNNVVLIGMMGTGKTTVGKYVASQLNYRFVDIDTLIEQHERSSIRQIFADKGERYFRSLESQLLASVLGQTNQVIATGGGCVLCKQNCESIEANGWVVQLTTTYEQIKRRLNSCNRRPLWRKEDEEGMKKLMHARKKAYSFAHCTINTTDQLPHQAAADIVNHYWSYTTSGVHSS